MKKNDLYALVVYAIMMAIAVVTGLVFVRPTFVANSSGIPLNSGFLFILLSVIGSIIVNSVLIELGHIVGAKIGGYEVYSVCILWFTFKKKNKKFRFTFGGFDGLTGETKVTPKSIEKSNAKAMIYMPLVFLLVEVAGLVALVSMGTAFQSAANTWVWWRTFGIVFLAAAFMIYIYDIFPAQLDNKNDGYLFNILTNQTNKEAYNSMLLSEYKLSIGEKADETPVYDKVTDFTSRVNDITLYKMLDNGDYEGALGVVEKTIACEKDVSDRIYFTAVANKVSLMILSGKIAEAKQYYISMKLDAKKAIASLMNAPTLRAYVLISGILDESYTETKESLGEGEKIIHKTVANKRDVEEKLLDRSFDLIKTTHPDWDLKEFEEEPEEENKEENENDDD